MNIICGRICKLHGHSTTLIVLPLAVCGRGPGEINGFCGTQIARVSRSRASGENGGRPREMDEVAGEALCVRKRAQEGASESGRSGSN